MLSNQGLDTQGIKLEFLVYALPNMSNIEASKAILGKIWEFTCESLPEVEKLELAASIKRITSSIESLNKRSKRKVEKAVLATYNSVIASPIALIKQEFTEVTALRKFLEFLRQQKEFNEAKFLAGYIDEIISQNTEADNGFIGIFGGKKKLSDNDRSSMAMEIEDYIMDIFTLYKENVDGPFIQFMQEALKLIPTKLLLGELKDCEFLGCLKENIEPKTKELEEYQHSTEKKLKELLAKDAKKGQSILTESNAKQQANIKDFNENNTKQNDCCEQNLLFTKLIFRDIPMVAMLTFSVAYKNNMNTLYGMVAINLLATGADIEALSPYGIAIFGVLNVAKDFGISSRASAILALAIPVILESIHSFVNAGLKHNSLEGYKVKKSSLEENNQVIW